MDGTVADADSVRDTLSTCDVVRLADFLLGTDGSADETGVDDGLVSLIMALGEMDGVWPICDTVLHRLPNGGYLARTLSLNSLDD